jgi:hypothetical protein
MNDEQKQNLLSSRTILERHFYLMVLSCDQCGKGPFELISTEQTPDGQVDIWYIRCKPCGQGQRLQFDQSRLVLDEAENRTNELLEVNPTDQPSELMDVGQWLALFFSILNAAADEKDRKEAQRLGYEATLCMEEALKFYEQDSDLPPARAVWTENSQQRLKDHPELFVRTRLLQMREKLPSIHVMRKAMINTIPKPENDDGQKKKHWWHTWFKKGGRES